MYKKLSLNSLKLQIYTYHIIDAKFSLIVTLIKY